MFSNRNTSCITNFFHYTYCFIGFFVRICINELFTNSSKRFRFEVIFENEHKFWSLMRYVPTAQLFRNWREQRSSIQVELGNREHGEVGRVCYKAVNLFPISVLNRSTQVREKRKVIINFVHGWYSTHWKTTELIR